MPDLVERARAEPESVFSDDQQDRLRDDWLDFCEPAEVDTVFDEIADRQGFNAAPELLSASQLDEYVDGGELELWRGVETQAFARRFLRGGQPFCAMSGRYFSSTPVVAMRYAGKTDERGDWRLLRVCLRRDVVLGHYVRLRAEHRGDLFRLQARRDQAKGRGRRELLQAQDRVVGSFWRWLVLRGVDVIACPFGPLVDEFLVLNRSAVRAQRQTVMAEEALSLAMLRQSDSRLAVAALECEIIEAREQRLTLEASLDRVRAILGQDTEDERETGEHACVPETELFSTDLAALVDAVRERSAMIGSALHGEQHWQAVARVGLHLIRAGANGRGDIAFLFALFHDSMRQGEGRDRDHGARAAALADELRGTLYALDDEGAGNLREALRDHDRGLVTGDETIGLCWDADRLCLPRLGITPDLRLLSTTAGRSSIRLTRELTTQGYDWGYLQDEYAATLEPR